MTKPSKSTTYLLIGIAIIFVLWGYFVLYDIADPYKAKTIKKISEPYEDPVYLIFNWETEDQIQVGKKIYLQIEAIGLPYNNTTLPPIEITIDETYLNYWNDENTENHEIMDDPKFRLDNWENDSLRSKVIPLRFIVPADIPIEYCDYDLSSNCITIQNIIHPAPFDLADEIKNSRISITASLVIVGLSSIVVWSRFRNN
ncbi:hypothetical protein C5F47_08880 [Nitrosopumilus cobalaminigenes]|uniref:Uncharacterized protein n=1 Tax=Nitrosopumilus cobalaminigenes TaxID=1470066 RepID=A0A7D5R9J7_9ARCH|nr:hypothetical protein [Nitrosopumilus cobalaminigenes]QLH03643.1 hypothetical protein C5F47_08880 [Nitrosopumilus cobalaminigenes]